jgi:hypothetical protein
MLLGDLGATLHHLMASLITLLTSHAHCIAHAPHTRTLAWLRSRVSRRAHAAWSVVWFVRLVFRSESGETFQVEQTCSFILLTNLLHLLARTPSTSSNAPHLISHQLLPALTTYVQQHAHGERVWMTAAIDAVYAAIPRLLNEPQRIDLLQITRLQAAEAKDEAIRTSAQKWDDAQ